MDTTLVLWPGAILFVGVLIAFASVIYLEQQVFPYGRDNPTLRKLQSYVEVLSGRDSSVVVLAFAVAGRFDLFLYGAAVGANLFWMSVLWLWWVGARGAESGDRGNARPPAG